MITIPTWIGIGSTIGIDYALQRFFNKYLASTLYSALLISSSIHPCLIRSLRLYSHYERSNVTVSADYFKLSFLRDIFTQTHYNQQN